MLGNMFCDSDYDRVGSSAWPQIPSNEIGINGDLCNKGTRMFEAFKIIYYKTPIIANKSNLKFQVAKLSIVHIVREPWHRRGTMLILPHRLCKCYVCIFILCTQQ